MKIKDILGVFKMMLKMTKEEWDVMDHKLLRVVTGLIGFVIAVTISWFFFRNFSPFF